jgi:O-antigen biosynthesis protein WbqV
MFVLDMGDPVRIIDLARDLARLAGRDPDSVPIQYIGLRPGEKLHEALFYDAESIEPTGHPKVLRARDQLAVGQTNVLEELDALVAIGATGDHDAARVALAATLARLQPAYGVPNTSTSGASMS